MDTMRNYWYLIVSFFLSYTLNGQEYLLGIKAAIGSSIVNQDVQIGDFYRIYGLDDERNCLLTEIELNVEYKKGYSLISGIGYMKQNTMVNNVHSITVPLGVGFVYGSKFCLIASLQSRTNFLISPRNLFIEEDMLQSGKPHIYKASNIQFIAQLECGFSYRVNESRISASIIHSVGLTSIMESEFIEKIGGARHYSYGVLYSLSYKRYLNFREEKPD